MRAVGDRRKVRIGEVVRNAVVFDFKNWQGGEGKEEPLLDAVGRFFALLEERGIDYLLAGGIALLQYVEGRKSEALDLLLATSSLARLPEVRIDEQDEDFARGRFEGLKLDFLLTENPFFAEVRKRHATRRRFAEREIPCATVEGLLVLKLYALPSLYRQGNFARVGLYENDVATLLQQYRPAIEPLFTELDAHVSSTDLAALRKIVAEIERRIERFEESRGDRE